MRSDLHLFRCAAACIALTAALAAQAAPTTAPATAAPEAEAERARQSKPGADLGEDAANSRTLRMLLELQQSAPPTAPAADPTAPQPKPGQQAQARAGAPSPTLAADREPSRKQPGANEWRPLPPTSGLEDSPSTRTALGSAAVPYRDTTSSRESHGSERSVAHEDYSEARRLVSPELVQFLRTHRDWILISSLGAVAGVWLLGAAVRRRR